MTRVQGIDGDTRSLHNSLLHSLFYEGPFEDDPENCGVLPPAVCSGTPDDLVCSCNCSEGFSGGVVSAGGLLCKQCMLIACTKSPLQLCGWWPNS